MPSDTPAPDRRSIVVEGLYGAGGADRGAAGAPARRGGGLLMLLRKLEQAGRERAKVAHRAGASETPSAPAGQVPAAAQA